MTTTLLDSNVLIALTVTDHIHHSRARLWFVGQSGQSFATTPITQGALLRHLIRNSVSAATAVELMTQTTADARHVFWPDDLPYEPGILRGVVGHRQVTDSYLAALARHRGGRIATFDAGFAASHGDIAELIPT